MGRSAGHSRPHPGSHRLLKRLAAIALLLAFGLFSLEWLIADVHDGDAPASVAVTAPDVGGQRSDVQIAVATNAADRSDSGRDDAPAPRSGHPVHACHCVHVHGFSVTAVVPLGSLPVTERAITLHVARKPDQVERDVHLRPPIA